MQRYFNAFSESLILLAVAAALAVIGQYMSISALTALGLAVGGAGLKHLPENYSGIQETGGK